MHDRRSARSAGLAHAPAAEEGLVASGVTGGRLLVMHNDFALVGPATDPAGLAGAADLDAAMVALASGTAPFVSRGDDSGTHQRERALWADAGVGPGGTWYLETGQGMGGTLQIADERQGYTLADRATFLATQAEGAQRLVVVVEDDRSWRAPVRP